MKRPLISLAVLAICAQAFAGSTPIVHTPLQPVRQGPTGLVPLVPQLTSAKFVNSVVLPGEALQLKFDGINLAGGSTGPGTACTGVMTLPPGFATNNPSPHGVPVAVNSAWQLYPGQWNAYTLNAPTLPGTYVVSVTVDNIYSADGEIHCKGTVTASLTVKSPPSVPQTAK